MAICLQCFYGENDCATAPGGSLFQQIPSQRQEDQPLDGTPTKIDDKGFFAVLLEFVFHWLEVLDG